MPLEKPPLGLIPRYVKDEARKDEIIGALQRYIIAGRKIPMEWIEEYNEIIALEGE